MFDQPSRSADGPAPASGAPNGEPLASDGRESEVAPEDRQEPFAGATIGTLLGGIAGGVVGGPVGAVAGGALGAAGGAAVGDESRIDVDERERAAPGQERPAGNAPAPAEGLKPDRGGVALRATRGDEGSPPSSPPPDAADPSPQSGSR